MSDFSQVAAMLGITSTCKIYSVAEKLYMVGGRDPARKSQRSCTTLGTLPMGFMRPFKPVTVLLRFILYRTLQFVHDSVGL